jgi:hypothetical protein
MVFYIKFVKKKKKKKKKEVKGVKKNTCFEGLEKKIQKKKK